MRHAPAAKIQVEWILVSAKRPCRICGAQSACRAGSDGEFACCSRRPSEWPLTNGGWLHRLAADALEVKRAG